MEFKKHHLFKDGTLLIPETIEVPAYVKTITIENCNTVIDCEPAFFCKGSTKVTMKSGTIEFING